MAGVRDSEVGVKFMSLVWSLKLTKSWQICRFLHAFAAASPVSLSLLSLPWTRQYIYQLSVLWGVLTALPDWCWQVLASDVIQKQLEIYSGVFKITKFEIAHSTIVRCLIKQGQIQGKSYSVRHNGEFEITRRLGYIVWPPCPPATLPESIDQFYICHFCWRYGYKNQCLKKGWRESPKETIGLMSIGLPPRKSNY